MIEGIIDYLQQISLPVWIGIAGFILSIINLIRSLREKRIKVSVIYGTIGDETSITVFNRSVRNIIITHLELYTTNGIVSGNKKFIHTYFDEPESATINISPYSSKDIVFKDEYTINGSFYRGKRAYIILHISNEKKITKRLR